MGDDGDIPTRHGAEQELPLGADIPDLRAVANRQPNRDQHKRCRLHRHFLQAPGIRERIEEISAQRRHRILAKQRKHDGRRYQRKRHRNQRGDQHEADWRFGATLHHKLHHTAIPAPPINRPSDSRVA